MPPADALPVVVCWLSSGLAAVSLAPRNLAARALLVAATCGSATVALEPAAKRTTDGVPGALLPTVVAGLFLATVTAMAAVLTLYPDGVVERRWHRRLLRGLGGLALVAPLLMLVGASVVDVLGADGTARANVLAVGPLAVAGTAGRLVVGSDPLFVLAGVVVLACRWRVSDAVERRRLRVLVRGGLGLAGLLVLVVVTDAVGLRPPEPGFSLVFLVALALLPVALLAGLSGRTRSMEGELAASRTRLVSAEDRVRRSIERDLHDGVQQQLVAILSLVQLAERQVRRDPEAVVGTLDDVREQVTSAVADLRELVYGIRPPVLADAGIVAALESRLERLDADVSLDADRVRGLRWAPEVEAAAYFVACEALTNALKHAVGSPVTVRLGLDAQQLVLQVDDTGPGLPARVPTGRGLAGLADRVASLGGTFTASPGPDGGTQVRAVLPPSVPSAGAVVAGS